jgi:DNA polymerase-3 subunit alpha
MSEARFVHLHNHSEYSLLDGAIRLPELVTTTKNLGMKAVALTDHGNLFGAVSFCQLALAAGIKPILGSEVYIAPGSRFEKKPIPDKRGDPSFHLILLVVNHKGYKNLVKLVTAGYLEGFYYKPRIDKELLSAHSEGLIALSACLQGEIPYHLLKGQEREAEARAGELSEIMGKGNFFLEVQDHGIPEEREVAKKLIGMAKKLNLPIVATNDCHYLKKEDAVAHDALLSIQTGKSVGEKDRLRFTSDQFYLKSAEEMAKLFSEIPEALTSTVEIAERTHFALNSADHCYHLPRYQVPPDCTLESYLENVAREGFVGLTTELAERKKRGELKFPIEEYKKRLEQELTTIMKAGLSGYFLIVWDFIRFAKEKGIPVGPGRGSGAGSLVAYILGITEIDPMQYGLLFERFLNPERVSLPDFDIDFCMRRRGEVIDYVTKKYGKDNVSQIITFGTMAARAVVRDVGRALDLPYAEVDRIAKLIPFELDASLERAVTGVPELKELVAKNPQIKQLIDIALKLEGLTRHASTHAAGVVITPEPLTELVPLYKGSRNEITTQYAMGDLEQLGLLKMDFLGLRTLTVIKDTIGNIKETTGDELEIKKIPLHDEKTFALFSRGDTSGVFQFESSGMRDLLRRFKPERFEDLIALNALYRPGPIKSGMVEEFIGRKHGRITTSYEHPDLEEILAETYGTIVYQEQVMRIASTLAGFSLGEADLLRRAMGKKKHKVMKAQREKFIKGAKSRGIAEKRAKKIFDWMEKFASYGFNKSHSAAYALIAYQTAYLKAHYPLEFMAALLSSECDNTDKIVKYINVLREMGIKVSPPDVNASYANFTVEKSAIRFGLAAIKNVGVSAVSSIVKARKKLSQFKDLERFCTHIDLRLVNKRVIESLIKAGALDSLGYSRSRLLAGLDKTIERAQRRQEEKARGQVSMFEMFEDERMVDKLPRVPDWNETKRLAYEKEVLGFYFSGHPLTRYQAELKNLKKNSTLEVTSGNKGKELTLACVISEVKKMTTKKGDPMAKIIIEDFEGKAGVLIFPKVYQVARPLIQTEKGVLVRGRVDTNKEEKVELLASHIIPLSEAKERLARRLIIELDPNQTGEDKLVTLKKLIEEKPGECEVLLKLVSSGNFEALVRANRTLRTTPEAELIEKIEQVIGKDCVSLLFD